MTETLGKFYNLQLSLDGQEVIYRGVGANNAVIEIRQSVGDLDVMLILIASIIERSRQPGAGEANAHRVTEVTLSEDDTDIVVALRSPPGVQRRFRLSRSQAIALSTDLKRTAFNAVG